MSSNQKKIFVLDTNVLLHDPNSLFQFQEHNLYIPFVTLEELDNHKVGTQEINRNARAATRLLEEITSQQGSFAEGFELKDFNGKHASGKLFMQSEAIVVDGPAIGGSKNDNKFLDVMAYLAKTRPEQAAVLVTKDLNLRVKARAMGFHSDDYLNDHAVEDSDLLYCGYRALDEAVLESAGERLKSWKEGAKVFYSIPQDRKQPYYANEMLILPDGLRTIVKSADDEVALLQVLKDYSIEKNSVWGITARNAEQAFALQLLMDPDVDFITLLGPAGTGKTLLTLAAALEQTLESKRYSEIIVTRATVAVGDEIGFLPGTEEEKMLPWMGALEDNLEVLMGDKSDEAGWATKTTKDLVMRNVKVKSMSFMRGRTFLGKFLIIDEAQNLTPKQMKTLVTRAGPGTKVVCMGNLAQIDTPYLSEASSGLAHAVEAFKGWAHSGNIILKKGERSRLADYANENM